MAEPLSPTSDSNDDLFVIGNHRFVVDDVDGDGCIGAEDRLAQPSGEAVSLDEVHALLRTRGLIAEGDSLGGRRWRDLHAYLDCLQMAGLHAANLAAEDVASQREHIGELLSIAQSVAPDIGVAPRGTVFQELVRKIYERALESIERDIERSVAHGFSLSREQALQRIYVLQQNAPALGWCIEALLPDFQERASRICEIVQEDIHRVARKSFHLMPLLAQTRLCAEFRGIDPEGDLQVVRERWRTWAQERIHRDLESHRAEYDPLDRAAFLSEVDRLEWMFGLIEQAQDAGIDLGLREMTRAVLRSRYERLVDARACNPDRCLRWRSPPATADGDTPSAVEPSFIEAAARSSMSGEASVEKEEVMALLALARRYLHRLRSYPTMAREGVNFLYGPVLDLAHAGGYMERVGRAQTDDPVLSAFFAELTIARTLQECPETLFVLKHAPGIGAITRNPECGDAVVIDGRSAEQLAADVAPFAWVATRFPGRAAVMVGGAAYSALDDEPERPALYSPQVISWLRERLPPDTVLVSDDLGRSILRGYINRRHAEAVADKPLNETKFALLEATRAGCDLLLFYAKWPGFIDYVGQAGRELIAEGTIGRGELEASVRRILLLKRAAFPNHPALQDVDATIAGMSIDELWAQRLVLPAWNARVSHHLAFRGAGGLAFEGVRGAAVIRRDLRHWIAEHPEAIPPLMADNSPQELADTRSSRNDRRDPELEVLTEMHEAVRQRFPDGFSAGVADDLLDALRRDEGDEE